MKFGQRLEIRQGQNLVMTPQLLQAIKLLQLPTLDLAQYIEQELESNPLLERVVEDDGPEQGGPSASETAASEPTGEGDDWFADSLPMDGGAIESRLDTSLDNMYQESASDQTLAPSETVSGLSASSWTGMGGSHYDSDEADLEAFVAENMSLQDHVEKQFRVAVEDPVDRMIGFSLIDSIDDAGYLSEPVEDIAERLSVPVTHVEKVLAKVQACDPTGVGARNLAECLKLQLIERGRYDPAMGLLLDNLALLARRDFATLRKICNVDEDDMGDMVDEIRHLDPKPGLKFGGQPMQAVAPDVLVRRAPDNTWMVELNNDILPKVLVNQTYAMRVSASSRNDVEKSYVAECLQNATWLTRSLEQRAKTILKVASEIVRRQDAFLNRGVAHLRPLNLKMVADAIAMHESTVSRVTSNKFMHTPRGLFEMKYFFTASISGTDEGEAHSAEAVRHRIKHLIDDEAPEKVLSDDVLVQKLRAEGIDIARRTVAKYRESLRIPSSVERRREKMSRLKR